MSWVILIVSELCPKSKQFVSIIITYQSYNVFMGIFDSVLSQDISLLTISPNAFRHLKEPPLTSSPPFFYVVFNLRFFHIVPVQIIHFLTLLILCPVLCFHLAPSIFLPVKLKLRHL